MKKICFAAPAFSLALMLCPALRAENANQKTNANLKTYGDVRIEAIEPDSPFGRAVRVDGIHKRGACLEIDGNMLYVGAGDSLYVCDVSEPMKPVVLGSVGGMGNVRSLTVDGKGYAYIAAREAGMWIVDVRDPKAPKIVTRYDCVELATGVDVHDDIVFLGQRTYGVEFIDVRDKKHPAHIRIQKTSESQCCRYAGDGYLVSGDWGMSESTIIDVRDMADVKIVSIAKLDGYGDGVYVDGNILYASTGHHSNRLKKKDPKAAHGMGHGLEVMDISDKRAPKKLGEVKFPKLYALGNDMWNVRVSNGIAYCADTYNGLFAVDVKDFSKMRVIGRITTKPKGKNRPDPGSAYVEFPSTTVTHVAVGNGAVYVTALDFGLMAVECPRAKGTRRMKGGKIANKDFRIEYPNKSPNYNAWLPAERNQVRSATVLGDTIYAACSDSGIYAIEMDSATGRVKKSATIKGIPYASDVRAMDGKLYVAEGIAGLAVYEIAKDGSVKEVGRKTEFKNPFNKHALPTSMSLWLWAPRADVVISWPRFGGMFFEDVSDPANIKTMHYLPMCPGWNKYAAEKALDGRYVAVTRGNIGFSWVDLGVDGSKPETTLFSWLNRSGVSDGCCNYKDKILLSGGKNGVAILEANQRENADGTRWKGIVRDKLQGMPTWDGGTRVAFSNRIRKFVALWDFADEQDPKLIRYEEFPGTPDTVVFWRGKMVIPCGHQGLLIEK